MSNRKRRHSEDNETDSQPKQFVSENPEVADSVVPKALEVIRREFRNELKRREWELDEIDDRLNEALRVQHLLRYAVVSSYYGVRTSQGEWPDASNSRQLAHPAIAGLSRKKKPKKNAEEKMEEGVACDSDGQLEDKGSMEDDTKIPTKVPCYIPPVTKKGIREPTSPTRGFRTKRKYRIIVGNVSRWIPVDCREDGASHKWMVYARTPPGDPHISQFVNKVRFFLHSSYRPFDVVEVVSPPFRLSRRGWGEFPIRVQVHFHNPLNKPIDIVHHLVLDKTKSGQQCLGAETVVEEWLFVGDEEDGRNECGEDFSGQQNGRAWEENSQGHLDGCSSDVARARHNSMLWSDSENVPSVFNECTLMREDYRNKELIEEESNTSGDDDDDDVASSSINYPNNITSSAQGVPGYDEGNVLVERTFIKEEPLSSDEQDNEEDFAVDHHPGREEVVVGDFTQECVDVKEEVLIEDGCFPVPGEESSIGDTLLGHSIGVGWYANPMTYTGKYLEQSQVPSLKVENTVNNFGDKVSLPKSEPVKFSSIAHGEAMPSQNPANSLISKQGPPKGTSLLKNRSVRPGSSLLIQKPAVLCTARTPLLSNHLILKSSQLSHQPAISAIIKPSIDPKVATYSRNYSKLKNRVHDEQEAAASHLLRCLPIVTPSASDPAYRALHNYAAGSLDEFFSWPIAKQRAAEWIHAGEVRKLLSAQGFSTEEDNAWTTKDIMMWARLRGYTPLSPEVPHAPLHFSATEERSDMALSLSTTFSEPKIVKEWLSSFDGEKLSPVDENDGEEIDVVNVGGPPKRTTSSGNQKVGLGLGARAAGGQKVILLGMETSLGALSRLVDEFSRKIGVIATCPEEISSCVFYPAAQRVLVEAIKSFTNDLVRGSYSYALRRTSESSNTSLTIKVEDVRNAVLNRQEFDILTNEGLSAEPDVSMKWDAPM